MARLNFPTTGLYNGYQYVGENGITYIFDGTKWKGQVPSFASDRISRSGNIVKVNDIGNLVLPSYTLPISTGQSTTVVTMAVQGTTAYYNTGTSIDGVSINPYWQGGAAPLSGNPTWY